MNWAHWIVFGFISTIVLTTIFALTQGLGMTRMNIPIMLGTMVTRDRDRAGVYGIVLHAAIGWVLSLLYVLAFEAYGTATWWLGGLLGLLHGLFALGVFLPMTPAIHPAMASERRGPTVVRRLEPPGFFGLNYGVQTPVTVLVAHVVFGVILGALYRT